MARKLTQKQMDTALAAVAAYLGPRMGYDGPTPTGQRASHNGEGPQLIEDWDWPGNPTPSILLEGGPYDWALDVTTDPTFARKMQTAGVFAEPYAGWALCLYPN